MKHRACENGFQLLTLPLSYIFSRDYPHPSTESLDFKDLIGGLVNYDVVVDKQKCMQLLASFVALISILFIQYLLVSSSSSAAVY